MNVLTYVGCIVDCQDKIAKRKRKICCPNFIITKITGPFGILIPSRANFLVQMCSIKLSKFEIFVGSASLLHLRPKFSVIGMIVVHVFYSLGTK